MCKKIWDKEIFHCIYYFSNVIIYMFYIYYIYYNSPMLSSNIGEFDIIMTNWLLVVNLEELVVFVNIVTITMIVVFPFSMPWPVGRQICLSQVSNKTLERLPNIFGLTTTAGHSAYLDVLNISWQQFIPLCAFKDNSRDSALCFVYTGDTRSEVVVLIILLS